MDTFDKDRTWMPEDPQITWECIKEVSMEITQSQDPIYFEFLRMNKRVPGSFFMDYYNSIFSANMTETDKDIVSIYISKGCSPSEAMTRRAHERIYQWN